MSTAKMKVSLHTLMAQAREECKDFFIKNPYKHPVEHHKAIADKIKERVKALNVDEVSLHPTVFMGGVPEYAQAVAMLKEAGVQVVRENSP